MKNAIKFPQSNNQYIQQFNRAVLSYEMFMFEQRQQNKFERLRGEEKLKKVRS